MSTITCLIASLLFLTCASAMDKEAENAELVLVHAYWRHGGNGALNLHDLRPANNSLDPECLVRLFDLGLLLKDRYVAQMKFLDLATPEDETYIRSLDCHRALTEAQALQAALFPSKDPVLLEEKGWPSNWSPLPVHTIPGKEDYLLNYGLECPMYNSLQTQVEDAYLASNAEDKRFSDDVAKKLSLPASARTEELYRAVLALQAKQQKSERADVWGGQYSKELERLKHIARNETELFLQNEKMIRLRAGPVLQEVIGRMNAKLNVLKLDASQRRLPASQYLSNLRFYGYAQSGNDDFWILSALVDQEDYKRNGLGPHTKSKLASCILFELWKSGNQALVKVLYCYDCSDKNNFQPLRLKGCPKSSFYCPLTIFEKAVEPYLESLAVSQRTDYSILAIVFGFVAAVLVMINVQLVMKILAKQKRAKRGYEPILEKTALLGR